MSNSSFLSKRIVLAIVLVSLGVMFVASFSYRLSNPSLVKRVTERQTGASSFGNEGAGMNTGMTPELMEHIGEMMMRLKENPEDFDARIDVAEHFMGVSDWTSATVHLQKAISIKPEDAHVNYNLGIVYFQQGNFAGSATCFEQVLKAEDDPSAMFNLGILYHQHLNKQDEGLKLFEKVAASEKSDAELKERSKAIIESLKQ